MCKAAQEISAAIRGSTGKNMSAIRNLMLSCINSGFCKRGKYMDVTAKTTDSGRRGILVSTGLLLGAMAAQPFLFIFSKILPASFWSTLLPPPFAAGWLISFILLTPAVWTAIHLQQAFKNTLYTLCCTLLPGVPLALTIISASTSVNNLSYQYILALLILMPPAMLQLVLFSAYKFLQKRR